MNTIERAAYDHWSNPENSTHPQVVFQDAIRWFLGYTELESALEYIRSFEKNPDALSNSTLKECTEVAASCLKRINELFDFVEASKANDQ